MAKKAGRPQTDIRNVFRYNLIGSHFNRNTTEPTKDQRFINCYPEAYKNPQTDSKKYYLIKRPGLTEVQAVAAGEARGCYYYKANLYNVVGNKVYKNTTEIQTLTTSSGPVGFVEASGTTDFLFLCDGTKGFVINAAGTITEVTDVDFPTPHIPQPVFMDGYVFLIKSGTSDIYNCDLEDPTSWNATNFITAEQFPDDLVGLSRVTNQVIAFGSASLEYFYDAANVGTSPLSRTDAASQQIGSSGKNTIVQSEKFMMFVGQSQTGGRGVWYIDGYEYKKVSNEFIDRIIDAEGTGITADVAFLLRTNGHLFYVLNLSTLSRTLVYDIEEKMWHEWSSNSSGSHVKFNCSFATDAGVGAIYLQHDSNGKIYKLDSAKFLDDTTNILVDFTTSKLDFENMNRKFMWAVNLIGDLTNSSSIINFRWTDDDYNTWSNWKSIDLYERPVYYRLGAFRRRGFNFKYSDNQPLRLEALECEVSQGSH